MTNPIKPEKKGLPKQMQSYMEEAIANVGNFMFYSMGKDIERIRIRWSIDTVRGEHGDGESSTEHG